MSTRGLILKFFTASAFGLLSLQASAVTTGLGFAGGCPGNHIADVTAECTATGGNASEVNVAAILGVDASLVSEVGTGFSADTGFLDGDWAVTDSSITHLAFKADTYFILAEVQAPGGTFAMTDVGDGAEFGFNLLLATCPDAVCTTARPYTIEDFQNNGGQFAELSNVAAFTVVPVPAAVWLFGSGLLGLVGVARRKRA